MKVVEFFDFFDFFVCFGVMDDDVLCVCIFVLDFFERLFVFCV